jgi:hypothetical protein
MGVLGNPWAKQWCGDELRKAKLRVFATQEVETLDVAKGKDARAARVD